MSWVAVDAASQEGNRTLNGDEEISFVPAPVGLMRPLTVMQRQVVRLCALGCTVKEVARILDLSPCTVDNHKARAMAKMQATNLAMLTRTAIRDGISPLNDKLSESEHAKVKFGASCEDKQD